jgi:hypothetical protein
MPAPLGERQTDIPINRLHLDEVISIPSEPVFILLHKSTNKNSETSQSPSFYSW